MKAAHQVLFIQGGGEGAFAADKPLAESLQRSLGADYEVRYPAMPNEDDPSDLRWRREIERELVKVGEAVVLVAHSVGAYILLKFLVSDQSPKTVRGIFLIATPFAGKGGWELNDLALAEDFADGLPSDMPIFLYHARDDEIVPFAHLAIYGQKISQATVRELESGGHQLNGDLSVVAGDIRALP